jgi:hypothetical protein
MLVQGLSSLSSRVPEKRDGRLATDTPFEPIWTF